MSEIADPLSAPFLRSLVSVIRAEDRFGAWERKPDSELLRDFIVTTEQRRAMPIIADPEPETLDRVEQFYRAAGLTIEQRTGLMASPMININHEGFGRIVLLVGRLVAFTKTLRDVHRFGFTDFNALAAAGEKIVEEALGAMTEHPTAANA